MKNINVTLLIISLLCLQNVFSQRQNFYYDFRNEAFKEVYLNSSEKTSFQKSKIKKHYMVNDIDNEYYLNLRIPLISFKKEYYDTLSVNPELIFNIIEDVLFFKKRKLSFRNKKFRNKNNQFRCSAELYYKNKKLDHKTIEISNNKKYKSISTFIIHFNPSHFVYNKKYDWYLYKYTEFDEPEIRFINGNNHENSTGIYIGYKTELFKKLKQINYNPFPALFKYSKLDSNIHIITNKKEYKSNGGNKSLKYDVLKKDNNLKVAKIEFTASDEAFYSIKIDYLNCSSKFYFDKLLKKNVLLPDTSYHISGQYRNLRREVKNINEYFTNYKNGLLVFSKNYHKIFKTLSKVEQENVIISTINLLLNTNYNSLDFVYKTKNENYFITSYFLTNKHNNFNKVKLEIFEKHTYIGNQNFIYVTANYQEINKFEFQDTLLQNENSFTKIRDNTFEAISLSKGYNKNKLSFVFNLKQKLINNYDTLTALSKIKKYLNLNYVDFNLKNKTVYFNKKRLSDCSIQLVKNRFDTFQIQGNYFNPIKNGYLDTLSNKYFVNADTIKHKNDFYIVDVGLLTNKITNDKIYFRTLYELYEKSFYNLYKTKGITNIFRAINENKIPSYNKLLLIGFKETSLIKQPFDSISLYQLKRKTGIYGAQDAKSYFNVNFYNKNKPVKTKYIFTFKSDLFSQFDEVSYGNCNYVDTNTFNLKYDYGNNDTLKNTKNKLVIKNEKGFVKNYYHNKQRNLVELKFDYKKITKQKDDFNSIFQTAYFLMNKNNKNFTFYKLIKSNYFDQYQINYKNIPITDACILHSNNILKFYYDENLDDLDLPTTYQKTDYKYLIEDWRKSLTDRQLKNKWLKQIKKEKPFYTGNQIQYLKHKGKYYLCDVYYVRTTLKNEKGLNESNCKRIFVDVQTDKIVKNEFLE